MYSSYPHKTKRRTECTPSHSCHSLRTNIFWINAISEFYVGGLVPNGSRWEMGVRRHYTRQRHTTHFQFPRRQPGNRRKKALKTAISGERGAVIRGLTYRNDGPGNSQIPERWPKLEGLVAHVSRQIWSG